MCVLIRKYVQILEIELDDLKEDIELLIEKNQSREKDGAITQYVLLENLAVLRNEICGIGSFKKILHTMNQADYGCVQDFIDDVEIRFKKKIEDCGFAEGIFTLVQRKLKKVLTYVTHV